MAWVNSNWTKPKSFSTAPGTLRRALAREVHEPVERSRVGESVPAGRTRCIAPHQQLLDRHLEELAGQRPRDVGHDDDLVGHVARRAVAPDARREGGADPVAQPRAAGEDHEQVEEAVPG